MRFESAQIAGWGFVRSISGQDNVILGMTTGMTLTGRAHRQLNFSSLVVVQRVLASQYLTPPLLGGVAQGLGMNRWV
jgi:hypothetical protein